MPAATDHGQLSVVFAPTGIARGSVPIGFQHLYRGVGLTCAIVGVATVVTPAAPLGLAICAGFTLVVAWRELA